MKKTIFQALFVLLWLFASIWSFNHINPWVGIGLMIVAMIVLVIKFDNFLKQQM
jgi:hypothetical protein